MTTPQQGMSLPLVLAVLLAMAMLGAAVLQSGVVHTRMAGDVHARNLTFQAAEGALRAGEALANTAPVPVGPGCSGGVCGTPEAHIIERWRQPGFGGWQEVAGVPEIGLPAAQFLVEYMGDAPTIPGCERMPPIPAGCLHPWYTITARSGDERRQVLLQSHYLVTRVAWRELDADR